ncbi:MAG TPA: DUF378 domain-containing protein [Noviherbaspirillum sp.]|nr:DUF378 domain-containing protein [Noviherbaspirillum sp.]
MATTVNGHMSERRHIPERRSGARSHTAKRWGALDWISTLLLVVGGLNWGLVGLFGFDLVATLFGEMSTLSRAVYVLVGLSALYTLFAAKKMSHS